MEPHTFAKSLQILNENQLIQYHGEQYDTIKRLQDAADESLAEVEDADDFEQLFRKDQLSKYKRQLLRCSTQHKVSQRAERLGRSVGTKLQGRSHVQIPPIINSSTFEYMQWTTKP